ncbi:MAG: hypothetical protein HY720_31850, partial [Planctomycetes bacterium]|nr:hypothetical protein [Planctomycetota bacterium]
PAPSRPELGRASLSARELRARLEAVRAANETAIDAIDREVAALHEGLSGARRREREAASDAARESAREEEARYSRRILHCRERAAIHHRNLAMSDDMSARLEQVEALGSSGVSPERVSEVVLLYENRLEEYLATANTAQELARLSPLSVLSPESAARREPETRATENELALET